MEAYYKVQDREAAGILLANRIALLNFDNAVVVGIPHGGVKVGAAVAQHLNLPMEIVMCRKLTHPAKHSVNIGSVSSGEIFLHDCPRSIPNDYLDFQTRRLRKEIETEREFYYGRNPEINFEYKTVILVDDVLATPDTLLACIKEIRKQLPLKLIVAIPLVQAEAARIIRSESDELVFLRMQQFIGSPLDYFNEFPVVEQHDVKDLLRKLKGELVPINK